MASRGDEMLGLVIVCAFTGVVWFIVGFVIGWWVG